MIEKASALALLVAVCYTVPELLVIAVLVIDYWTFTAYVLGWEPTVAGKRIPLFSFLAALMISELPLWVIPLAIKGPLIAFGGGKFAVSFPSFAVYFFLASVVVTLTHLALHINAAFVSRRVANDAVNRFCTRGDLCKEIDGPHQYKSPISIMVQRSQKVFRGWHGATPLVRKNDIPYGTLQEEAQAGSQADMLRLDILKSACLTPRSRAPVLFYIHGGGWSKGLGDKSDKVPIIYNMAELGWVVVSINYRLFPDNHWPDYIIDCKRALRWVKQNIATYGGDPDMLILSGSSAGGHLASLLAVTGTTYKVPEWQPGFEDFDMSVQGCVAWYPATDTSADWFTQFTGKDYDKEAHESASPHHRCEKIIKHINEGKLDHTLCPFLVIQGQVDALTPTPNVYSFYKVLKTHPKSSLVEYVEFPNAQHAFDMLASPRSFYATGVAARFCTTIVSKHKQPDKQI